MTFPRDSLSIIVPAYNVEAYVAETLESVFSQEVPPDEILVIDDGSTDGTWEALQRYRDRPNLRLFRTVNQGLGPARNFGLALARSSYIHFLDADDRIDGNFVGIVKAIVAEHAPDLILFSGLSFLDEGFEHSFSPGYSRRISGLFGRADGIATRLLDNEALFPSACHYISRRSLWSEHRLCFPPIVHEDEAVFMPLLLYAERTFVDPAVYYHRRIRQGSIMTSPVGEANLRGILHILFSTVEFMAAERQAINPERKVWRSRVRMFGLQYLDMARRLDRRAAAVPVLTSIVYGWSLSYLVAVLERFMPDPVSRAARRLRERLKALRASVRARRG